ncbi:MAG: ATP-dependent helicase [Bacilli bacterium]|jgi:DNA helicase-2/ATP-dependent DNA helicase PcrA
MNLDELNERQKEAVLLTKGPLLILAGAGSGKTRVLTTKIAYLIIEKGISPSSILAITFTNKASKEMKERVNLLIGEKTKDIQISTFHSFGYKIVRENYHLLGLEKNFSILDENDSISLIRKVLKKNNLDPKHYNPKGIKQQISGAKNELLNPLAYSRYAKSYWEKEVLKIYKDYQQKLQANNAVDFDDLLMLPVKLFKENPQILDKYQEHYKYILIDEYQDTNEAQYVLTKKISFKYQNICVVGDGDQSIYGWRGANYKNILNFEKDYPKAKVILLEKNYRSTKNILKAANNVIKNNKLRKEKTLITDNEAGSKIKHYLALDEKDETLYVAEVIKRLLETGISLDEIAVLYRTNAQSQVFESSFTVFNIPYKIVGALSFYKRKEIKDLVAYLKLIYNEKDNVNLLRCINTPRRGIGEKTIEDLINKAEKENVSVFEAIDYGKPLEFKKMINQLKEISKTYSLTELVEEVLKKSGLEFNLKNEGTLEANNRLENLYEFKSVTLEFEKREEEISLESFLKEVSLISNSEELKEEDDKVSLMTVHAAKGLEFEVIFIVGLEEGIMPHYSAEEIGELEEERRLFYVAVTRAKKHLYLVSASQRMRFGEIWNNNISPFIKEIGEDYIEGEEGDVFYQEVDYQVGDLIFHEKFGQGIIKEINNDLLTILFSYPYQMKQFMKKHKSIKKIN